MLLAVWGIAMWDGVKNGWKIKKRFVLIQTQIDERLNQNSGGGNRWGGNRFSSYLKMESTLVDSLEMGTDEKEQ